MQVINVPSTGRSKYRGVHYAKHWGHWVASIHKDGVKHFLGNFKTELEAHEAYKRKAKEFYGRVYNE